MPTQFGGWGVPGQGSLDLTSEKQIIWGYGSINNLSIIGSGLISGAAIDSGNTPTNVLRPGLTLGIITASGKYTNYAATATDGSQVAVAFLMTDTLAKDFTGTASDRVCPVLLGGCAKVSQLLGFDTQARSQLNRQFLFDDLLSGFQSLFGILTPETANYTIVAADNGKTFTNAGATGAITLTLPAIAGSQGMAFRVRVVANQNVTVSSAEGSNIIVTGNATASNVAFSTPGQLVGGFLSIGSDGTYWYVDSPSRNAITVS